MKPSTQRAARTAYQAVLAMLVIIPVLLAALPLGAQVTAIVAAVAAAAKIVNVLEDAGLIPAWLKAPTVPAAQGPA